MVALIFIVLVAVAAYFIFSKKNEAPGIAIEPETPKVDIKQTTPEAPVSTDRYNDPDVVIIRNEIRAAVAAHSAAISMLQALSRIDGTTSEAERNLVFEFLNRQGAGLTYDKHRPWFYTSRSGEWSRAATLDECDEMILSIMAMPLLYRIDVFATVSAIAAVGGVPKKREAEMLKRLKKLLEISPGKSPIQEVDNAI